MAETRIPGSQHPEAYRQDLNPNALAGENHGTDGSANAPLNAADIKDAHRVLRDLTKAELRRIPVLRAGQRLDQGATYIDLAGDCREFTAMADQEATPEHWFVRKDTVDYVLWNRLIGVSEPARLDQPG
ncbi:MAG: hypothetical protein IT303_17230 [Dehalococcoidia bacterium]|nr:hypothetical protein [Dehalococcoidia bacterium]